MKLLIYFFLILLSAWGIRTGERNTVITGTDGSEAVKDRFKISGPLRFGNASFSLAWSDKPNETYYVQEYLPKEETVDHFNQLLTVNLFNRAIDIDDAAHQKVTELNERKKTDPYCNYAINRSRDGKEYMIDFLLSEGTGGNAVAEFTICRYRQIVMPDKTIALLVYAYSKRSYGNDITGFLTRLKTERPALLQLMSDTPLPAIVISDK